MMRLVCRIATVARGPGGEWRSRILDDGLIVKPAIGE
jgi:hypothetical protein